ncbi:PqqD family protein [Microbacterium sp. NPDC058342]|uniref:PqqD family protein n=1 Tax=Microbacterium sp. NPDC058342 TaxID=3346454 RepID=UPI00365FD80B
MSGWGARTVSIAGDVAWTSTGERVVVLDLQTPGAVPCVLEKSAAVIWEEIAETGPLMAEELLRRLTEVFDVAEGEIRAHLEALIDDLARLQLIAA